MVKSMTAFGRATWESEERSLTVELKSVNSRFFDCTVKLPRRLSFLEDRIRNYVKANAVSRAKVDVYITLETSASSDCAVEVDFAYAESYLSALKELRDKFGVRDDISVMSLARNPDIFTSKKKECDLEQEWELIRPVLDAAIRDYTAMRTAEGAKAERDITEKMEAVRTLSLRVAQISESDTVGYRDKLEARIRQILGDAGTAVDENRLLTECAIFADKIAIDEELVRLNSHFGAFYEILKAKEPSGRKLDFLMQELNRETNTIGSKANNAEIARIVVEMKGELEKIREQVQNIE